MSTSGKFLGTGEDAASVVGFLRDLRKTLNVTQAELGRRIGVSRSTISKFERHGHKDIVKLARYFESLGGKLEIGVSLPRSDP